MSALKQPVRGLRIGLPREFFAEGLRPDVAKVVEAAVAQYKGMGCEITEIALPNMSLSLPVYYVLAPAEASSNLARFDGVRYGYRTPQYSDLDEMYEKTRAEGFGAEVKRRILIGTYVLSHGYYDAYYIRAQKVRRLIAEDFARGVREVRRDHGSDQPYDGIQARRKGRGSGADVSLRHLHHCGESCGLPGMSIPCGFDAQGLPVGLQIIGNYFREAQMLNVAHQYQLATDWHARTPPELT